jgi:hypothetical protein
MLLDRSGDWSEVDARPGRTAAGPIGAAISNCGSVQVIRGSTDDTRLQLTTLTMDTRPGMQQGG